MVDLALALTSALGVTLAISDDRLTRINRMMPIADFHEVNLFARCVIARLGEDAGWRAMQVCGIAALATMMLMAAVYPWMGWAVVAALSIGLAVVSFDLFHDVRELRLGLAVRHSSE